MPQENEISFDQLSEQAASADMSEPEHGGHEDGHYDIWEEYAGEIETHWLVPNKKQPTKKFRVDVRLQALSGGQLNIIHRKAMQAHNAVSEANYYQQQLAQHLIPRNVFKLRQELAEVNELDYETSEAAETKRDDLEKQITNEMAGWQERHDELKAEFEKFVNWPTFYQVLCQEYFEPVIDSHTIFWRGRRLDFANPRSHVVCPGCKAVAPHHPEAEAPSCPACKASLADARFDEPPDKFVAWLKQELDRILLQGKVKRSNGRSQRR